MRKDILDLSVQELDCLLLDWGHRRYRAKQVWEWIYKSHAGGFGEMTNLPGALRERLASEFEICRPSVVEMLKSAIDGSLKLLVRLYDDRLVESVLIPSEPRLTLCLSTQVGCKFGCAFCASGANGFTRNLSAGEILAQVLLAARAAAPKRLSHIVFMGMGEPLDNLECTIQAAKMINSELGFNIGWRRITVSTIGIPNSVEVLTEEAPQLGLSFSLHAVSDEVRSKIVPANRLFPVASIIGAAQMCFKTTGRLPTFEYVLIDGLNCEPSHAKSLCRLLKSVRCKVNLVPLNPTPSLDLRPPNRERAYRFLSALEDGGIQATIRHSKGGDIAAACGQLVGQRSRAKNAARAT